MAKEWVNFAEVRRIRLEDVLFTFYSDIKGLTRNGNKIVGPCPVHGSSNPNSRAFSADLDKNLWHCFSRPSECGGGNVIDFVAKREGISVREAALRLKAFFLASDPPTTEVPKTEEHVEGPADEEQKKTARTNSVIDVRLQLKVEHPYLTEERGFPVELLRDFGIGYCSRGMLRGCIAFPIHNRAGELVAYAGRRLKPSAIKEKGLFRFPKNFSRSLELYNLHRALAHGDDLLVVVNGFFDVVRLSQAGFTGAVALMDTAASAQQIEMLQDAQEVMVMLDANEAGTTASKQLVEALCEKTKTRVVWLPEGEDPARLSVRTLRWIVNGMRELDLSDVGLWVRVPEQEEDDADS